MENNSFEEIWDKLKEFKKAIITLHSGPDGDSLGSCTAMKYVLEKYLNYEVTLISYDKLSEALKHSDAHLGCKVEISFIETSGLKDVKKVLENIDGVIVPGGFGKRGAEGKIKIIRYCRENKIPFLGICYGLQLATVEFVQEL